MKLRVQELKAIASQKGARRKRTSSSVKGEEEKTEKAKEIARPGDMPKKKAKTEGGEADANG